MEKENLNNSILDNKDLVSVIIPVYNGERFLAEAIESVEAQDYRQIEIIVVDDGSTDKCASIANKYPEVQYAFQPHQGLASALNHGLNLANGAFLAFLDADDLWVKGKLSLQMTILSQYPEIDIVFGHYQRFYSPPICNIVKDEKHPNNYPLPGYSKITALIRREAFRRVGLFDITLKMGDFIDWFSRAQDEGLSNLMLPQMVSMRRIHGDNTTILFKDNYSEYVRIVKKTIDRRRQKTKNYQQNPVEKDSLP